MALAGFIGLPLLVDAADVAAIGGNGRSWYVSLSLPAGAPPGWLFGPGSIVSYVLMGVAAWWVWRLSMTGVPLGGVSLGGVSLGGLPMLGVPSPGGRGSRPALRLWGWQLLATAVWPPLFFGLHALAASILAVAVLLALVVATARAFWRVRPVAGGLLLPYLGWTCYAGYLTVGAWWLNPSP